MPSQIRPGFTFTKRACVTLSKNMLERKATAHLLSFSMKMGEIVSSTQPLFAALYSDVRISFRANSTLFSSTLSFEVKLAGTTEIQAEIDAAIFARLFAIGVWRHFKMFFENRAEILDVLESRSIGDFCQR
jgi:hypothetical protein